MKQIKKYAGLCTLIGSLVVLSSSNTAWAQSPAATNGGYDHAVQVGLGFNRGQIVFNGDYEFKLEEHFGFGGNFYFTPDDHASGYEQIVGLAVHGKIHIPYGDFDFYARPGFGAAKVEYKKAGKTEDTIILAPIFGVGGLYRVADNVSVGAEYLTTFNWTENDVFGTKGDFLIMTQIRF